MAADQTIDERIRARARRLWEEEGCPEGRAAAHWEQARRIVALEDSRHAMREPSQAPAAEPFEVIESLGEFRTLADQGEEQTHPRSRSELATGSMGSVAESNLAGSERFSPKLDAPNGIMRFASESARYYTAFLFMSAAAAGLALSLFLKSWFRDRP